MRFEKVAPYCRRNHRLIDAGMQNLIWQMDGDAKATRWRVEADLIAAGKPDQEILFGRGVA